MFETHATPVKPELPRVVRQALMLFWAATALEAVAMCVYGLHHDDDAMGWTLTAISIAFIIFVMVNFGDGRRWAAVLTTALTALFTPYDVYQLIQGGDDLGPYPSWYMALMWFCDICSVIAVVLMCSRASRTWCFPKYFSGQAQ